MDPIIYILHVRCLGYFWRCQWHRGNYYSLAKFPSSCEGVYRNCTRGSGHRWEVVLATDEFFPLTADRLSAPWPVPDCEADGVRVWRTGSPFVWPVCKRTVVLGKAYGFSVISNNLCGLSWVEFSVIRNRGALYSSFISLCLWCGEISCVESSTPLLEMRGA